jgi:hypothetical protein
MNYSNEFTSSSKPLPPPPTTCGCQPSYSSSSTNTYQNNNNNNNQTLSGNTNSNNKDDSANNSSDNHPNCSVGGVVVVAAADNPLYNRHQPSQSKISNYTYKKREGLLTCQSAFETDPDVILLRNAADNNTPISAVTKKYLSYNNLNHHTNVENNNNSNYTSVITTTTTTSSATKPPVVPPSPSSSRRAYETKFENDYVNIFSLKLKKEEKGNAADDDSGSKGQRKSKKGVEIPIRFEKEKEDGGYDGKLYSPASPSRRSQTATGQHKNERYQQLDNSITDTMESTHMDSDYAKGPIFPSDVYGSRHSPSRSTGIYHRKRGDNQSEHAKSTAGQQQQQQPPTSILKTKNNHHHHQHSHRKDDEQQRKEIYLSEEKLNQFCEESSVLDPECLKLMDKKLRKLMKKNKRHHEMNNSSSPPANSWDIPWKATDESSEHMVLADGQRSRRQLNRSSNENETTLETSAMLNQSYLGNSTASPYLPLKDVPVNDLVKKLRHEFELSGDVSSLNAGLDNLWQK